MRARPAVARGTKTFTRPSPCPAQNFSSSVVRSTIRSREASISISVVCILPQFVASVRSGAMDAGNRAT